MLHRNLGKKAEGLPFQIIIIAIILLVTVVVVLMFFTGKFKNFGTDVENCFSRGGSCVDKVSGACPPDNVPLSGAYCYGTDKKPQADKICCIKNDFVNTS